MKTRYIPQIYKALKKSVNPILFLLIAIPLLLPDNAYSQIPPNSIAKWDFNNGVNASFHDPDCDATDFSVKGVNKSGLNSGTCDLDAFVGHDWNTNTSIDTTQYYEFTVAPNPGKRLQMLRLVFNIEADVNGPVSGEVRSNLDGFTTGISPFPANPKNKTFKISDACEEVIIHLNALGKTFNNVAEPVTFRIYAYGSSNAFNRLDIDMVNLVGNVVPGGPLPVELINFDAVPERDGVKLHWATAMEINNDYFTIERSIDGKEFTELTTINGAGNSTDELYYEHLDNTPVNGLSYYRLKQTDLDGKFSYSPIVSVKYSDASAVNLYPNPAYDHVNIQVQDIETGIYNLTIFDLSGRLIQNEDININGSNVYQIPLSHLQQGSYYIRLENDTHTIMKKFTKS